MAEVLIFPVCSFRLSPGEAHIRCAPLTSDSCSTVGSSSVFYESRRWNHADLVAPSEIGFSYDAFGKPELTGHLAERLRFNVSHADDRVLNAFAIPLGPFESTAPVKFPHTIGRVGSRDQDVRHGPEGAWPTSCF